MFHFEGKKLLSLPIYVPQYVLCIATPLTKDQLVNKLEKQANDYFRCLTDRYSCFGVL